MRRRRESSVPRALAFRIGLGCTLLIATAVTTSVLVREESLPGFDHALGDAVQLSSDDNAPAMDRPGAQKGVKLDPPRAVDQAQGRSRAPLKSKKECAEASKDQVAFGIEAGTEVCVLTETRQSPDLVDARPLVMAEGFEPAPIPEPAETEAPDEDSPDTDGPEGDPGTTTTEPTDDGVEGEPGPDTSESPDSEPDGSEGSRAPPATSEASSSPARQVRGSAANTTAAFTAPQVVEPTPGTYLSPNWTKLDPPTNPTGVLEAKMVYDPVRAQFVLFGGRDGTVYSNETWVWSGTSWTKLNPATKPPARNGAGMAWDPVQQKVILFGGQTSSTTRVNDVWAWDGVNWAQQTPTGSAPSVRSHAGFAFDPIRGALVLFGGVGVTASLNDTWQLKNNAWTLIQAAGSAGAPAVRNGVGMAYSDSTSQLVLFGGGAGSCSTCLFDDTWVLPETGSAWVKQTTAHAPSARGLVAMAYDPGIGAVVLFGGISTNGTTSTVHNDTWAWTGTDWSQAVGIASPQGRAGSAMAADDRGQTLLFGGVSTENYAETWTYDSTLPVLDIEVTNASDGTEEEPIFWVGDSAKISIKAVTPGVLATGTGSHASITSAFTDSVLAAGTTLTWRDPLDPESLETLDPCDGTTLDVCGGVSDLTTTISNISIPAGSTRVGDFVATIVGTQRGCELIDIPAITSSITGGVNETFQQITVCGGGLGLENWWTYDTTDLGSGGTASVNAANGNLVVKQYDTAPVQSRGRLALGLARAYNSQDHMSAGGPLGAGWQFDIGDTGETAGGFGIAGLKLLNLQSLTQPLSMPYIDRDGTRHVFRLRSVGVAAGDLSLPVDLSSGPGGIVSSLLGGLQNLPFNSLLTGDLTRLCVDQAYTGPKGTNMFLFRYIATASSNTCAAPGASGVSMGWSLVRPDRVRYDFDLAGNLIRVTDPTGQQLIYTPGVQYGPTEIYTKACGKNGVCPKITIDYNAGGSPSGTRHVKVTDTAGRVTSYVVTTDLLMPQLTQVWLPGNALSAAEGAKASIIYTYSTGSKRCPGPDTEALTVGQLCSVVDAQGGETTFSYTKAPLGPDRILQVTDRRGNDAENDGTNKGLATLYGWHDKTDGSPDYVTADMGTPNQVASCGTSCQRIRYGTIDAYGRVGQIDEGTSDDVYLRQAGYFWDGGAIATCSQPSTEVNHNLCQTIRRAVPRTGAFAPGDVTTGTVNGVTVHDQAVDYLYGEMGQQLRQRVLLDASQPWTDANSSITTWGTKDQYFDANGDQRAYNSHVEGNGSVASTGSGVNYVTAVKRDAPVAFWRLGEASGTTMQATVGPNGTYGGNLALGYPGAVPENTAVTESTSGWGSAVSGMTGLPFGTTPADSDFTVETWQKTTDTGQEYALMWGQTGQTGLVGRTYGGKPMIVLTDANGGKAFAYTTASIADGNWHHVVYTYDGSRSTAGMKVWVDGASLPLTTFSNNLTGAYASTTANAFMFAAGADSHIDELSVFTKVLSPARIKAHHDAANGGERIEADTLYAVTDQIQELSPRGNSASNWGDFLTTIRRDVPQDGETASTFKPADTNGICGSNARGNTGLACEVDTPASNGTPAGVCTSPAAAPPAGSGTPPTSASYAFACSRYLYNTSGQRTQMYTPKANASGQNVGYEYKYYDDTDSCSGAGQDNCDLSGSVSAGGWLKAVVDPAGEKSLFAYDAAGNIARTWERNAAHGHALGDPWTAASNPPSTAFLEQVNATPVTSDSLSVSNTGIQVVAPDGTARGAGQNASGELGDRTTTARSTAVPVDGLSNVVKVSQSGTGAFTACAATVYLTGSGEVWSSGNGIATATRVDALKNVIDVRAAGCHMMALDANGGLWAWGNNGAGQIGNGSTTYVTQPVKVLDNVALMTGGYLHSLAVKTDGTVWAWGRNTEGQLGLGDTTGRTSPTQVTALTDIRGLAAGVNTSYAIGRDGKVWSWGHGLHGGLGLGDTADRNTPTRITTLGQGTAAGLVKEIVASAYGAAALMADGKVRAWGLNNLGQLGAAGASSSTPAVVPGVANQVALAGGWATYASADLAGTITVWGSTANSQRADGTNPSTSTPTKAGIDISPYRLPGWQLRGTRDATGNLTTTTYDRLDLPRRIRSGRGNDVLSSAFDRMVGYDAAGRPITLSGAQHRATGTVATTSYDAFGNPVKQVDANGIASRATFDAVNRQLTAQVTRGTAAQSPDVCSGTATASAWTTGQDGHQICVTSATWDGVDRQVTLTDADSQVTRYLADAASRQTGVDTPRNAGSVTYVKSRWLLDKDGNTTTFCPPRQLDAGEAAPSGSCASGGKYSATYDIDRAGRTTTETRYRDTTALVTGFGYDADGNTVSVSDPNGHTTTQTFDLQGRLQTRTVPRSSANAYTTRWSYDYTGNTTAVRSPGSLNTGSGADGNLVIDGLLGVNSTDGQAHGSGNPFQVPDGAQYRNVTLQNGAHLTAANANGLMFTATGTVTVCTNCSITMRGKGQAGGLKAADAANPNPGNGGLKGANNGLGVGSGGGGGGHKNDGAPGVGAAPGAGGLKSGTADFSDVGTSYLRAAGGGGGGGGNGLLGSGGAGGNGGGYIRITASKIVVNGSGTITAAGAPGANGGANSGGGGGGAGGGLWLAAQDITLASATTSLSVAGGAGGTGANNNVGGAGAPGYLRLDADAISNEPSGADGTKAAMITAISYDAANRPVDTIEGAQTLQANPALDSSEFAVPDANGMGNTRTRAFYNADGQVAAILPPTAFSDAASLTAPNLDVARRVDYDLDGRVASTYAPRFSDTVASVGTGNDGGTAGNQQTGQCTADRRIDALRGIGSYGASVGVCVTRSTYDAVGNIKRQRFPTSNGSDNRYLEYAYTGDNLARTVTGPDPSGTGRVTARTAWYDGTGNPTLVEDANGNGTAMTYTGDDLVETVTLQKYQDGTIEVSNVTSYRYDANGNNTRITRPTGDGTLRTSIQTYTSDNLVKQIVAPGSGVGGASTTKYTYDKVGNPIEVYDPNAVANSTGPVVNEFTHDNLILATHTPITGSSHRSVKYSYSPAGMKVATETARCASGNTANCTPTDGAWNSAGFVRLTYGANGRPADQIGRDTSSISTTYTQDGHLKKVTDPTSNVTVTAGYYLDGRVRTVDDGANANTYAYDASGQVTVRTDQTPAAGLTGGSKLTTSYGYSQAGLPASMTSDVLDQNTTYAYDVAGRLESAVTGSHRVDWGWYPDNSVAHVRNADGATTFGDFVYHYFDSRNIRQQVVTGAGGSHTDSYTYLAGDQVSSWTNGTATTTYKYDASANRTEARLGTGVPTEWAYHRDNSIASVKSGTDTKAYSYNNAGLLTSDGCSTTSYDDFDRVAKVEVSLLQSQDQTCGSPDKRTTTYSYDGLDRQRSSAVTGSDDSGTPNVTTKSIFDGLSTTTVGQTDAVSGNRSAAEVIYQLDAAGAAFGYEQSGGSPADGHKAFLDTDGQGNVTNVVTLAGGNACTVHYDPFGSGVDATGGTSSNGLCQAGGSKATTTANAVWYRGSVRDGSVGTYQFGTRTYNPASGAFTTPDSYRVAAPSTDLSVVTDPLTMNTYTYVNGNPVNVWDPSGHWGMPSWDKIRKAAGGSAGDGDLPMAPTPVPVTRAEVMRQELRYARADLKALEAQRAENEAIASMDFSVDKSDLILDLVGWTDATACFGDGDWGACGWTIAGFIKPLKGADKGRDIHLLKAAFDAKKARAAELVSGATKQITQLQGSISDLSKQLKRQLAKERQAMKARSAARAERKAAARSSGVADSGQVLYRADTRPPSEIFAGGFRAKGTNNDLWAHVSQNPADSGFISTTHSLQSAQDFSGEIGADYIYRLRGSGFDVNATFGDRSPFPWENEIAIPGRVSPASIDGAWTPDGWVGNPGARQ